MEENITKTHNNCTKTKCVVNDGGYCIANFCIQCGVNMGDSNPRQYCAKTYCYMEYQTDEKKDNNINQ